MEGRYNTRSPAVKRLMREAQELSEPTDQYYAQPLEDNLFEWHFTVRGPADSDFQHGVYHGRIILPMDYPMKPPSIIWLTPNGRFETNKKICLSISGHHPESWQPSWSIRTALLAIIGFMPTRPGGAIGSLDYTPEERKVLAKKSQDWKCPACGSIDQILLERSAEQPQASQEAKDLAAQIQFQGEKSKSNEAKSSVTSSVAPTLSSATESTSSASTEPKLENQPNQQPQAVLLQPPGFSPWNFPGTMPAMTQGFPPPMTWPGLPHVPPVNAGCSPLAMIPRFPYPPSQQPIGAIPMQFYPPGFPMVPPQALGAFPFPQTFSSPASPQVVTTAKSSQSCQVSVNNSSTGSESSSDAQASATSLAQELSENNAGPSCPPRNTETDVSSTAGASHQTASDKGKGVLGKCTTALGTVQEIADTSSAAAEEDHSSQNFDVLQSSCKDAKDSDITNRAASHGDDEEGTEQSQLELPADKPSDDDNSQSSIPPIDFSEGEQRSSHLERSVSSSVPDLEKQSRPGQKGLRYRQSATAAVPTTEASAEAGQVPDSNNQTGQRIEAASGDTYPRLVRTHHAPRVFAEARVAQRNAVARSTQHQAAASQYDGSFFAMVILGIATVLILLNRLVRLVDWSSVL